MTGLWLRARSELRADRRSLIILALTLGVVCGVVLTAAGGARRTDTAYPRFLASVGGNHYDSKGGETIRLWDPATGKEVRQVKRLPEKISSFAFSPAIDQMRRARA